ncbi:hypothetical protein H8L32_09680 [Undibacterium sp. CY18W]|uniref:Uncharacterized protein n=1 Tax=Undibacterium hunanense TaxID=2762292 RepID=A0ABR6ZPA6_9BURK|nr:hypothetical protein [Undibacterium hunanense]MBC3917741.1 hypothetical protein [Undibacterium hunanense]
MNQFEELLSSTQVFSDANLNARFYTAIELLAQIMMVMPRTANITTLAQATGKTPRLIRSILATLNKDDLVSRDAKEKDAWHCRDCNGIITLADVYRCFVMAEEKAAAKAIEKQAQDQTKAQAQQAQETEMQHERRITRTSSQQSVDLLMMQVKMTLNRAVLQQLEQFDLGRLRGLASNSSFRRQHARPRGYIPEPF